MKRVGIIAVFLVTGATPIAFGQHGYAENGLYNFNYKGDMWTGEITAFDKAAKSLTLTYEHKGKVQTFTRVIKPAVHVVNQDDQNVDPTTVRVKVGEKITVYYVKEGDKYPVENGTKQHDEVAKANIIFKIKLLGN